MRKRGCSALSRVLDTIESALDFPWSIPPLKCMAVASERSKREGERSRRGAGDESRRKTRWEEEEEEKEEERTIPCAHDGTKMQSPGINEETRSCWSKFSRRGWE